MDDSEYKGEEEEEEDINQEYGHQQN